MAAIGPDHSPGVRVAGVRVAALTCLGPGAKRRPAAGFRLRPRRSHGADAAAAKGGVRRRPLALRQ